jgi:choline-glycine betaine transporter
MHITVDIPLYLFIILICMIVIMTVGVLVLGSICTNLGIICRNLLRFNDNFAAYKYEQRTKENTERIE